MFTGVFSSAPYYNEPTADIGGHRVLNMGGSLTNYINNGKAVKNDSFVSSSGTSSKKQSNIKKVAAAVLGLGTAAAGAVALVKTGSIGKIKNLFSGSKLQKKCSSFDFSALKKKYCDWSTNLKIKNIEKKADKKIANIDLNAYKKQLNKTVQEAKKAASQRVKNHTSNIKP